jgi:hypothetical protein
MRIRPDNCNLSHIALAICEPHHTGEESDLSFCAMQNSAVAADQRQRAMLSTIQNRSQLGARRFDWSALAESGRINLNLKSGLIARP